MNIKKKVLNAIAKLEDNLKFLIKCYKGLKVTCSMIEDIKPQVIDIIESIRDCLL